MVQAWWVLATGTRRTWTKDAAGPASPGSDHAQEAGRASRDCRRTVLTRW